MLNRMLGDMSCRHIQSYKANYPAVIIAHDAAATSSNRKHKHIRVFLDPCMAPDSKQELQVFFDSVAHRIDSGPV